MDAHDPVAVAPAGDDGWRLFAAGRTADPWGDADLVDVVRPEG